MNAFEKSEAIKAGLRNGFQNGDSKMARRKCYGYEAAADGTLEINICEARIVRRRSLRWTESHGVCK